MKNQSKKAKFIALFFTLLIFFPTYAKHKIINDSKDYIEDLRDSLSGIDLTKDISKKWDVFENWKDKHEFNVNIEFMYQYESEMSNEKSYELLIENNTFPIEAINALKNFDKNVESSKAISVNLENLKKDINEIELTNAQKQKMTFFTNTIEQTISIGVISDTETQTMI